MFEQQRQSLPLGKIYFWTVISGGTAASYLSLVQLIDQGGSEGFSYVAFLVFAVLGALTELVAIPLPKGGHLTASFPILFACLLELGYQPTLGILAVTAILCNGFLQRRSWKLCWFNFSQYALSYLAASQLLQLVGYGPVPAIRELPPTNVLAFAMLAYLLTNILLVDGFIAIEKKVPLYRVLWEDDRWEFL
ncbi:MAG: hypothetical protein HY692_03575, partial [Cyanobacteria bacterium NC_groundwater_1444_Ag_S-0.65um_54_12]|nr:hypothetical protein [Cyanobacteria bacterium NC_groundwater_1444_Ag_S-0.65um_54_12]